MKRIIVTLITIATTNFLLPATAAPSGQKPAGKASPQSSYTLTFPTRGQIGKIGLIDDGADYTDKHTPSKIFSDAKGQVLVPKGKHLYFVASDFMGIEKPIDILCTIPPELVTSICLKK